MPTGLALADYSGAILRDMENHVQQVSDQIRVQFILQGHSLTGKAVNSLETESTPQNEKLVKIIDYAIRVDQGISAAEVRQLLSGPQRQEYLRGLTIWVQRRNGGSIRNARTIAIRIARVASKTGHPTPGSLRFSKNRKRTGFIADAIEQVGPVTSFPTFEKLIETIQV